MASHALVSALVEVGNSTCLRLLERRNSVCFISAHLDDVVLSCGHLLGAVPGSVALTVFAGAPDGPAGAWDRLTTGQPRASDALAVRRAEDADALARLGATPVWLDFLDGQYQRGDPRDPRPIAAEVARALDALGACTVVAPLGLLHPDHIAVADACLLLAPDRHEDFYLYLDMPYAQMYPAQLAARLAEVGARVGERSCFRPDDVTMKQRAVGAYASQLRWLKATFTNLDESMIDAETYWRVAPPIPARKESDRAYAVR